MFFGVTAGTKRASGFNAAFSPSSTEPVAGQDVTFTNSSVDAVSYSWDFGDGTVPRTETNPTHYFVGTGPYTVTLTATDSEGNTDTATSVISPTAPSPTANQTIQERVDFTTDLTGANYNTTYNFDAYQNSLPVRLKSVPVGGKLAGDSGVGHHCHSTDRNWFAGWSIAQPSTSGVNHQIGAWIYLEELPDSWASPLQLQRIGSSACLMTIESDGTVKLRNSVNTDMVTIYSGTLPTKEWFWMGLANSDIEFRGTVIVGGTTTQVTYNYSAMLAVTPVHYTAGMWNKVGNADHNTRIAHLTLHTLSSLSDAGYPNEVVPPQSENYVYKVDPDSGSDSNDGVTGAWQSIDKTNDMLSVSGVLSNHTAGTVGSGPHLEIDTSSAMLDVEEVGLRLYRPGIWVRPPQPYELQTDFIDIKPYVDVDAGDWTPHATYSGIWQTPCDHLFARAWEGDTFYAKVASEADLDAAAAKASYADGTNLFIKPDTDPTSDGKSYRFSRLRPITTSAEAIDSGNPIGWPAVAVAAPDVLLDAIRTKYTAVNNNGSYAIGDVTGFSSKLTVRGADCRYGDKHLICFTINATDSEITVEDSYVEQGLNQILTSYMDSGSGNVHNYVRVETGEALLLERSSAGSTTKHGGGTGVFYCHGGAGGVFAEINFIDCTLLGNATLEAVVAALNFDGGTYEHIKSYQIPTTIESGTLLTSPPSCRNLTADGVTIDWSEGTFGGAKELGGSLTNSTLDFRGHGFVSAGIFNVSSFGLIFQGNTVRYSVGTYSPLFGDCETADFDSVGDCDDNTYHFPAGSTLVDDFDDGGGPADYTFAQWQSLGYDATSTRIDPV